MTEIKVERDSKGGALWWLWALLALLVIAALLWWLLDDDDDAERVREPVVAEAVVAPAPIAPAGNMGADANMAAANRTAAGAANGPITDASMLFGGIDDSMVGRSVQLSGVPVMQVVSDAGFWIGESDQRRTFVVLNEQRTPNTATEGRVDVNQGQRISLSGTVRTKEEALRGLAMGDDAKLPKGVNHFLVAERVQVQN